MAKQFAASFSKLKNFETCAFKYLKVDVQKQYTESSEQLEWGNKVHTAFERAIKFGEPLPENMKPWQRWVTIAKRIPGEHLIEQKWALTRDFKPTEYFGPTVWWRGRGDFVAINDKIAVVLDWKTGAQKHDSVQNLFTSVCVFAHHPEVERIRSSFIWLQDDCSSSDDYTRDSAAKELKSGVLERVAELEQAHLTQVFPKRPSGLCVKWCPVDVCEFHKKGTPR